MFDVVPRIAIENTKTPADIIKMGNFILSGEEAVNIGKCKPFSF